MEADMHAATAPTPNVPPPPALSGFSIPDLLASVITRLNPYGDASDGPAVTLQDFLEAEETCHLSEAEIAQHIGAAKRLVDPRQVKHDQPPRPVYQWDTDRVYRAERIDKAASILAGHSRTESEAIYLLRLNNFSATEIGALWDEIDEANTRVVNLAAAVRSQRALDAARVVMAKFTGKA
jgi:hypothetical protein